MKFYIRLSPSDKDCEIEMEGIPLKNLVCIGIEKKVREIPQITLDLALFSDDVIIQGDGTVSIGDLRVPSELAYKIYEKLKEQFEEVKE